ncbi:MAG: cobalamin biosynthesis protein [Alphaproteobacteria bacterium]|nr:cobalamin biosynthesis protein [Alphaproteobacteria bacterium]
MFELYTQLHAHLMNPDRIPYAMIAILVVAVVGMVTGPLGGNANPFLWQVYDVLFGRLGERLDKPGRGRADLMMRGFVVLVFALVLAYLLGRVSQSMVVLFPLYGLVEILFLSLCLSAGSVWFALLRLYFTLEKEGKATGVFYAISRTSRVNLNSTDDYGIVRTAMGVAAVSFDRGLVAPVFWYLVGGLPLVFVYSVLAALVWRFGKGGTGSGFADIVLALEKIMGIVPTLLAGALFTAASGLTPTASLQKSLAVWREARGKVPYAQGGIMLAALAWPLGVSLGGPVQDLSGDTVKNKWVGPEGASAKLDYLHLRRALYMSAVAHLYFIAALGGAYLFSSL